MTDLQWLIGGEAGYGIMTTGLMMSKILTRLGYEIFDYVEYPSLIRGGHNAYYVRFSDHKIYSQNKNVDILVALNSQTVELHKHELSENAAVVYDPNVVSLSEGDFEKKVKLLPVPFLELTKKVNADRLMINTVATGASLGLLHDSFEVLDKILKETFGKKGEEVISTNMNTSRIGFDYIKDNFGIGVVANLPKLEQKNILIGGAEAIALGAIRAGLKFAAIYPMTPINAVMTTLTMFALKYSIVLKEPEDEISGINMALGASFAGARSLVATSGGGFSLMVESLGLAAQTETPITIIMGMRPGPATGMPTWTEQGDLRFVLHAAQGDFPRIVLAPSDFFEEFSHTMLALNLADKYQMPVIVLVDKYLNEGHAGVNYEEFKKLSNEFKIERGKLLSENDLENIEDYKRYLLTDDGVSPRSIPGQKNGIGLSGSDEHDEKGLYNETSQMRIKMMDKRYKKLQVCIENNELPMPTVYSDDSPELTVVTFGSTKLPVLDSKFSLNSLNRRIKVINLPVLEPFPDQKFLELIGSDQNTVIIEGNRQGQLEGLIREKTGYVFKNRLRKYDGRPFYHEDITEYLQKLL